MKPHRRYSEEEKKVLLAIVEKEQEQSGQPLSWILPLGMGRHSKGYRSLGIKWRFPLDKEKGDNGILLHGWIKACDF